MTEESKYTDNPNFDAQPEFVDDAGNQYAVRPQDDDKIFKYAAGQHKVKKKKYIIDYGEYKPK